MALVLGAMNEAGMRVPQDIALAGFDDIPIARYVAPPLTTMRVGFVDALRAWLAVGFDETVGTVVHMKLGRRQVEHAACDPELVTRYLGARYGIAVGKIRTARHQSFGAILMRRAGAA